MKRGVTKVKHPNKGHTPNKGQKPMYQGVRYSESPLYIAMRHIHLILNSDYLNSIEEDSDAPQKHEG